MTNIVKAAYDQQLEFALRAMPCHRNLVDKRPVAPTSAGSSVVFSIWGDPSAATSTLTESTDPDAVAIANPSQVTVTLNEYGNAFNVTTKLGLEAFASVDAGAANLIAYNMVDSIDQLVRTTAVGGTNKITANGTTFDATAQATNTLVATDVLNSPSIRYAVAKLRGGNALPWDERGSFAAYTHPDASYDLRSETGSSGWLLPHQYSQPSSIWAGEIGIYEGARWVETPRGYQATDGSSSAKVTRTLIVGKQALVEAVADEPHVVIGPVVDKLLRNRPIGWKALVGWARYREAALYRIESGSSI